MSDITLVLDCKNEIGECPTWSEAEEALYWVDIAGRKLQRWHPETDTYEYWEMPEKIGSFGFREAGGLVVSLASGVYYFDTESRQLALLVNPEPDKPENRLNDGKVSPEGRFWVGSMQDVPVGTASEPLGSLYRIDPDGSCHRMLTGIYCSNGLAWSPDGRTLFFSDSRAPNIQAFDYDPDSGAISNGRVIATPLEADGRPDGAGMDESGIYWSAGVSAGCLNLYNAQGELIRKIHVPTPSPTMCCFGGKDRKTLYFTSHRERPGVADSHPTAGGLFKMRVDVPGVRAGLFKG